MLLSASAGAQLPEPQQRIDVFARFGNGAIFTCNTTDSGISWSIPTLLEINLPYRSSFQIVSFNPQRLDVFSLGGSGFGHHFWKGGRWDQGRLSIGVPSGDLEVPLFLSPTVVQLTYHLFILFYVDNRTLEVWCRFGNYDRMDWSDWNCLGGECNAGPVAISRGRNIVDLFYVGLDGGLYWNSWADMAWKREYEKLGNGCQGGLEAVALHRERIDVFVVGSRGELRSKVWNGKSWDPSGMAFLDLGGNFESQPAVVARDEKRFDLFIIGMDGKLYHKAFDNSIWKPATGFRSLGGKFCTSIPPTAVLTKRGIHVFLVGGAGTLGGTYHKCWDGADEETPWEFDHFFGWHCSTPISVIVRDIVD